MFGQGDDRIAAHDVVAALQARVPQPVTRHFILLRGLAVGILTGRLSGRLPGGALRLERNGQKQ
ncbi:MAG: hypothetical protein B7Z37_07990 [Verrucomicrobia bacterium 12-59-8]|nr:MAG: hypothetical protein B7Z37_07990 [Verrucomicrobia bacterium 12-59-8]